MFYALSTVIADSGHMFDSDWGDGWWIVMMIGMVVFWALVILGGAWIVRSLIFNSRKQHPGPLEILDRRFAEGEIDEDEYQKRRTAIESCAGPSGS